VKSPDNAADIKVGHKTPDEIKKGLECCNRTFDACHKCPYDTVDEGWGCTVAKNADALALIKQLEAENAEKDEKIRVLESRNNAMYHTILGVMHFVDKWLDVPAYDPDEDLNGTTAIGRASQAREITLQAIEQLEAERDAAVADLKSYRCCHGCKHLGVGFNEPCLHCDFENNCFEWRGVQKEETK